MIEFEPIKISRKEKSKCTYYELYSIKNKRNMQLYSQASYYQALVLEMNHKVKSYCERPNILKIYYYEVSKTKVIDFIVEYHKSDVLELQRICQFGTKDLLTSMNQTFKDELDLCKSHGYSYQTINIDSMKNNYYFQNTRYLYGLIRRINSPIYNKYVDLIINSLQRRNTITISSITKENNISQYEAFLSVSFGLYRGIFNIPLEFGVISLDTEVKLVQ